MKNKYGISEVELSRIRKRDKCCVYCGDEIPDRGSKRKPKIFATIEHLYPPGNDPTWVCFCCNACNSSHRMPLSEWFKTDYCLKWNINENTVAPHIQNFLKSGKKEYDQMWVDGPVDTFIFQSSWRKSPHQRGVEVLIRSMLSKPEKKCFDKIVGEIKYAEFRKWDKDRDPKVSRYKGYEYWAKSGAIYRRKLSGKTKTAVRQRIVERVTSSTSLSL